MLHNAQLHMAVSVADSKTFNAMFIFDESLAAIKEELVLSIRKKERMSHNS